MEASSNDNSLQTLEPAPPRSTTVSNRDPIELSRNGTLLGFNKWMDAQTKHQQMVEALQRQRDEEWTTLAKDKIDRKVRIAEQSLVNKTALMQIRIAEGAKIEKECLDERQALLKKWREFDQNLMRHTHLEQGVMLAELFKAFTDIKDKERDNGGCGKGADTRTPPESPEDALALVHDPDESLEQPTKKASKVVRFVEGTHSPGRQFDNPTTIPASSNSEESVPEPDEELRVELEEAKEKLRSKDELLERAVHNLERTVDLASQFDTNVQQQQEIAQQQQLEIRRLTEENDRLLADSGRYGRSEDSDTEEEDPETDIDIEGVSTKDVVLYLDDLAFYVVNCPSPCSLSWEEHTNISMEHFMAHLDLEHPRCDGTGWTTGDAEIECCILILDADFEWFARERLAPEDNKNTTSKGKKDRLSRVQVLETIHKQNRDLANKIDDIKDYQGWVEVCQDWIPTKNAATQAIQSVPDSTIANGQKRQREAPDDSGDEQTEADEPSPCKKLKTPERTTPARATPSISSPPSSVGLPALERETPGCSRCSASPDRGPSPTKDTSKEALSRSTYVSPYRSPPRDINSAPKVGNQGILQFNKEVVASMVKGQVRDARTILGDLMSH